MLPDSRSEAETGEANEFPAFGRTKEKEDAMSTKLYEKFVSQLELKGYAKRSINSYLKSVNLQGAVEPRMDTNRH